MRMTRRITCAAAVIVLVAPGAAAAATPRPELPAIEQYIEDIPTSAGEQSTGGEERVQPLPPDVQRRVDEGGGSDAEALTKVATSSRYGAPTGGDEPEPAPGESPSQPETDEEQAVLDALQTSVAEDGGSRGIVLVALMLGSLLAALAYRLTHRARD